MAYFRRGLGAITAGPVTAITASLTARTCPSGLPPGQGYVWDEKAKAWGRAQPGQCGVPKPAPRTPYTEAERKDICQKQGVPEAFVGECARKLAGTGPHTSQSFIAAQISSVRDRVARMEKSCIDTGMPPELVPACVKGLAAGRRLEDVIGELQAAVAEAPKKSPLLFYVGVGLAGYLAFRLLRRS